jgi:hypothetical protein
MDKNINNISPVNVAMTQPNIQLIQSCVIVSKSEYESTILENQQLKQRVSDLTNQQIGLLDDIKRKDIEIEILRKENIELREKIKELEKKIDDQNDKIDEQNDKIKQLSDTVMSLIDKELFRKYIVAIQDINSYDRLQNEQWQYNKNMKKIHNYRLTECHLFLTDYDSLDLIEYKKLTILFNLLKIEPKIIKMIETKFGTGLINAMITHIQSQNIIKKQLSDDEINEAYDWWTD